MTDAGKKRVEEILELKSGFKSFVATYLGIEGRDQIWWDETEGHPG